TLTIPADTNELLTRKLAGCCISSRCGTPIQASLAGRRRSSPAEESARTASVDVLKGVRHDEEKRMALDVDGIGSHDGNSTFGQGRAVRGLRRRALARAALPAH